MARPQLAERNKEILEKIVKYKWTYPRIARHYKITEGRISQIVSLYSTSLGYPQLAKKRGLAISGGRV